MKALHLLLLASVSFWAVSVSAEPSTVQEKIAQKNAWRAHVMAHSKSGRPTKGIGILSGIAGNDQPEDLVDSPNGMRRTLEQLEQEGLRSAWLPVSPWSDDYWPVFKGGLGARYADPAFPRSKDWAANRRYTLQYPASQIIQSGDPRRIDLLSPSEKYELLAGDASGVMTQEMWRLGEEYYDSHGKVEDWIGFCHGWAVASHMLPRPNHAITVKAANGVTPLKFYPADIKALASLLWAQGSFSYRFLGGRCEASEPATDVNGRVRSQDCFDTNPASWHLALTHQVGALKRSLIFDSIYDYEVWNQPIRGYSYGYFNPVTGRLVRSMAKARIPMSQLRDKFRAYRSSKAVSIVGISMDLTYVNENKPSHAETDTPQGDVLKTVRYYYDLELDAHDQIVGGEWYSQAHPDFLWLAEAGTSAISVGDSWISGIWNEGWPMPATWFEGALHAARSIQPLAAAVNRLVEWSSL